MKTIYFILILIILFFIGCSDDKKNKEEFDENLNLDWKVEITSTNHSIAITLNVNPTIKGEVLSSGDTIGVFYKDEINRLRCGGKIAWKGNEPVALSAFGKDETLPDKKNGFAVGESFIWKIKRKSDSKTFSAVAEYESGPSTFQINGLTILKKLYVP
jgi:hypothetical protein